MPMQYTENFFKHLKLKISLENFNMFARNIDHGCMLEQLAEGVLTSTHNLCFGTQIRKIGIPLQTPVFVYKSGV